MSGTTGERLEVREITSVDDPDFAVMHEVYETAQRLELGRHATIWYPDELAVWMREGSPSTERHFYAGYLDGAMVASGYLAMPLLDNLDSAEVSVEVAAPQQRRGLGTQLLAHLEDVAREKGRTRLDSESGWRTDRGYDGEGNPGREFLVARGFKMTLGDVQREVALPVDEALLDRLAEETAPHHRGYTLRSWVGRVPDDVVESWVALSSMLMTEAPMGEGEREPERPDVDAFRVMEGQLEQMGRTRFHAVALDADGEVAAYTDIGASGSEPGLAYQWGTLVRRADRGHRLGTAVKVANHRQLQAHRGSGTPVERVVTWNAEVNSHMIGINERLGFVPVARLGEFQKRLG